MRAAARGDGFLALSAAILRNLGQRDEEAGTWGADSSEREKGKASIGASPRKPQC